MNLDLNPLEVLGVRQLNYMPPHFVKTALPDFTFWMDNEIVDWVRSKLKGRFALVKMPTAIDNKIISKEMIGFEDAKEMTYFLLACPNLRRT